MGLAYQTNTMSLFEKPIFGDEYSPKKNAPIIFMPVTLYGVAMGVCGIVANLFVVSDGPDGKKFHPLNLEIENH